MENLKVICRLELEFLWVHFILGLEIHFKCTFYMATLYSMIISTSFLIHNQMEPSKIWSYFYLKFYFEMLQKLNLKWRVLFLSIFFHRIFAKVYCCFTLFFLRCFSIKFWQPTLQSKLNLVVKNLLLKSGGKMHIIMLCLLYLFCSFVLLFSLICINQED